MADMTERIVLVTPSEWVQGWILEHMNGYSLDAQKAKRSEGVWEEGVHWCKAPDGRILYNWRAIDKWAARGKAA
jgi:hypothetical protein